MIDQNIEINKIIIDLLNPIEYKINARKVKLLTNINTDLTNLLSQQSNIDVSSKIVSGGATTAKSTVDTTSHINNCVYNYTGTETNLLTIKACTNDFEYNSNSDDDDNIYQIKNGSNEFEDIDINDTEFTTKFFNKGKEVRILFGNKIKYFNDYKFVNNTVINNCTFTYKGNEYKLSCKPTDIDYNNKSITFTIGDTVTSAAGSENNIKIIILNLKEHYVLFNNKFNNTNNEARKYFDFDIDELTEKQVVFSKISDGTDTGGDDNNEIMMTYSGENNTENDNKIYVFHNILFNKATQDLQKKQITEIQTFLTKWNNKIFDEQSKFKLVDFFVNSIDEYLTLRIINSIQIVNEKTLQNILNIGPNDNLKTTIENYKNTTEDAEIQNKNNLDKKNNATRKM